MPTASTGRRHPDPVDEARIARSWGLRRIYEEQGYVFPDHPPPPPPAWMLPPGNARPPAPGTPRLAPAPRAPILRSQASRGRPRRARGRSPPYTCVQTYFSSV
jgi:hypothetical protein